ncbi:FMN-binding negative transcriptional regulator [Marinirhabdus gelatinilytica]|uniref:PaiB family negative transcriptional regulator n=1 Tax=Marinirhabdus gelatinilytica TaxID=1703343 RepID=A0A370Q797_9FLAO|nr:FMN-binding negative transcriptional regulator [Marinirhabdus gelatinilytica]RDK84252.1 PaiB family negative transcriptional regulator [Marinirhabdus gelatinilytica]
MYPPLHHQSDDPQKMIAVMKQYPFATLVSAEGNTPYITHIPVIYNEESGKLVAHIDRQNPQVATLKDDAEVTVVFKGPDSYISPNVYSTPQLPTWNYIIVHLTGKIKLIADPEATKKTMVEMTDFLEQPDHKFKLEMDDPRMDRLINYIQAFEVEITHWEGKFKLSQDKNAEDFERAKKELIKKLPTKNKEFINKIYKS